MFGRRINFWGGKDGEPCGLCFHQSPMVLRSVPLRSVDVVAKVAHAVAEVEVTQVFLNSESNPIVAIYYFPLDSNGAVVNFEAELDGKKIKGVAKINEEARQDYEQAVANNQTAFLGEETKADIFKVSVGYLKPGNEAKIVLRYVTEVKNERGTPTIRFCIPTTIAPRYTPVDSDEKSREVGNIPHSLTSPSPISILVYVGIQGDIASIKSPSHQIKIESKDVSPNNANWTQAAVSLLCKTTDMDRAFILLVTPQDPHQPRLYLEERPDSIAFMTHLIPSFRLDEQKSELIFFLDRSGSMGGSKIMLAKKALKLFLHSLPADCYFNIISFGGTYEFLFKHTTAFSFPHVFRENSFEQSPQSAKYTNETLRYALSYTDNMFANMGGTEILKPLKIVYESEKISGYLRQVFVLTDGEVSNTEEIIGLTKAHAHDTRVFSLGMGNSASHHLVEGIATAGGGTSIFVNDNEPIDRKVLEQLKDAIQPALTNVQITWEGLSLQIDETEMDSPVLVNKEKTLMGYGKPLAGDTSVKVNTVKKYQQAPEKIPPVFDGSQSLIFGVFTDVSSKPTAAIITAESPDGPLSIRIELSDSNKVGPVDMIHKLAAIKIVREIEMKSLAWSFTKRDVFSRLDEHAEIEKNKKEIIDIAVREGIASKYTSFIAVDSTTDEVLESKNMLIRHVPSKTPHGSFAAFGGAPVSQRGLFGCAAPKPTFHQQGLFGCAAPRPTFHQQGLFGCAAPRPTFHQQGLFGCAAPKPTFHQQGLFGCTAAKPTFGSTSMDTLRDPVRSKTSFGFGSTSVFGQASLSRQPQFGSYTATSTTAFGSTPVFGQPQMGSSTTAFGDTSTTAFGAAPTQSPALFACSNENSKEIYKEEPDKLFQIISFQSFDGSFIWDSNLIQILELMPDVVKQGYNELLGPGCMVYSFGHNVSRDKALRQERQLGITVSESNEVAEEELLYNAQCNGRSCTAVVQFLEYDRNYNSKGFVPHRRL